MIKLASGGLTASILAAVLAASALPGAASASASDVSVRSRTVELSDLQLDDRADARVAYKRLERASRVVCRTHADRTLTALANRRRCADRTLAEVVARLDAPVVTAIYQQGGRGRYASDRFATASNRAR